MTDAAPTCPDCASEFTYERGELLVCSMCGHEWNPASVEAADAATVVKDAVGNVLADGDTVTVVKTLKVKGSSAPIKAGTKVRNIRLVNGVGDHDIDCRVDGFGAMQLKSSVVRKA
ncbi:MAG TPA: zinc ribbon domain-containing protein YjdM [Solirubrobacteraceae bacterium]|nr:zinc ribbon domain-containing protein YjdM [Solirubrobacteraceae bacterium]